MQGTAIIITRVLYGLKTSAKAWREFFTCSLKEMGYSSCCANLDVWMNQEVNKEVCKYWSYMLVSIDDCLAVHDDPDPVMEDLKSCYKLKWDSYGEPD